MQQYSFDLFIDLLESALHVSGDELAHLQEHFRLCTQICYDAPILLPIDDKVVTTLSLTGSNIGALYQSCIYSQKCS